MSARNFINQTMFVFFSCKFLLLRVTFNHNMTWHDHIVIFISSCYSALSIFMQETTEYRAIPYPETISRNFDPIKTLPDCCNSVFSMNPEYQMKHLQRIQNRCASFVLKLYAKLMIWRNLNGFQLENDLNCPYLKLAHKALQNSDWPAYLTVSNEPKDWLSIC